MLLEERFDYLRLIFRVDAEVFQSQIIPQVHNVIAMCKAHIKDATTYKMAPLGTDSANVARFALDIWGELADYFIALMPLAFFRDIYRVDLRAATEMLKEADIQAAGGYFYLQPMGGVSVNTFKTPGATKTDRRDVGGTGIRFGSRKSDQHLVIYKRRGSDGAIEYRLQGKLAKSIGVATVEEVANPTSINGYTELFKRVQNMRKAYLKKATGQENPMLLTSRIAQIGNSNPPAQSTAWADEQMLADDWWAKQTEEEQANWQQATFDTTPRGRQE